MGAWYPLEMTKILLVEDDIDVGEIVSEHLASANEYTVDLVTTGSDARDKILKGAYDAIILDWDLPGVSGIDLCKEFRAHGGLTPVLMMTGRKAVDEKEAGFDAGADDYITKPFALKELSVRVKALLRRAGSYSAPLPAPSREPHPGMILNGKYRLEEVIGEGGMAVIWRATDTTMGREVVVKVLQGFLVSEERSLKRFEQEYKALAKINHPNVVTIYDTGSLNDRYPFIVMEYVKGDSLRDLIEQGPIPATLALRMMIPICDGLQEAHEAGVIHRDLKPDNILVQDRADKAGAIKLVDFGIALLADACERITRDDMVTGTVEYISPEQLGDVPIDSRVDIYALGIMLFELLTGGDLPFEANTAEAMMMKHLTAQPRMPSARRHGIPKQVDKIVEKCLQKRRDLRFQSALELRREIERVLKELNAW